MKYTPEGRIDLSGITVYDYEIDYALRDDARNRTRYQVWRNIAIGKHCGSYDWRPAWEWHQARVKVPA